MRRGRKEVLFSISFQTKQNKIKEGKKEIIEKKKNCINVLITNVN